MDLREARVGEEGAPLVRAPGGGDVRVDGVGGQVVGGAVAAGREADGVGTTMPRALPSITTRSSISRCGNSRTVPASTCRIIDW
jgi:hypothetical protein